MFAEPRNEWEISRKRPSTALMRLPQLIEKLFAVVSELETKSGEFWNISRSTLRVCGDYFCNSIAFDKKGAERISYVKVARSCEGKSSLGSCYVRLYVNGFNYKFWAFWLWLKIRANSFLIKRCWLLTNSLYSHSLRKAAKVLCKETLKVKFYRNQRVGFIWPTTSFDLFLFSHISEHAISLSVVADPWKWIRPNMNSDQNLSDLRGFSPIGYAWSFACCLLSIQAHKRNFNKNTFRLNNLVWNSWKIIVIESRSRKSKKSFISHASFLEHARDARDCADLISHGGLDSSIGPRWA